MTENWAQHICQSPFSPNLNGLTKNVTPCLDCSSPIDNFYNSIAELITKLNKPTIANDNVICGLILVSLISATESYVRKVFSEVYYAFPEVRYYNSDKARVLASSLLWYGEENIGKALLDGKSLASEAEIKKFIEQYFNIKTHNFLDKDILEKYDEICHMRHCIVHSHGYISSNNASTLSVKSQKRDLKLLIDKSCIHNASTILTAIVVGLNSALFNHYVNLWANNWPRTDRWESKSKNDLFKKIWKIFYSQVDSDNGSILAITSQIKCKNTVEKFYS
jgi:hypothetical protein